MLSQWSSILCWVPFSGHKLRTWSNNLQRSSNDVLVDQTSWPGWEPKLSELRSLEIWLDIFETITCHWQHMAGDLGVTIRCPCHDTRGTHPDPEPGYKRCHCCCFWLWLTDDLSGTINTEGMSFVMIQPLRICQGYKLVYTLCFKVPIMLEVIYSSHSAVGHMRWPPGQATIQSEYNFVVRTFFFFLNFLGSRIFEPFLTNKPDILPFWIFCALWFGVWM